MRKGLVLPLLGAIATAAFGQEGRTARSELIKGGNEAAATGIAAVAERLHAALHTGSAQQRQQAVAQAKKVLQRLPETEVTRRILWRIDDAQAAGLTTDEGREALTEAAETAQVAVRLLKQRPPSVDPSNAQGILLRVLSSAEFHDPWAPLRRLWERVWRWLSKPIGWLLEQLGQLFGRLGQWLAPVWRWLSSAIAALANWVWSWLQALLAASPVLVWSLIGLVGATVVISIGWSVWRWWQKRERAIAQAILTEALATPEQLLREAETSAQSGDYFAALRKSYRALLLLLDRMGFLRFQEQRTNWEHLAEVRRRAPMEVAQSLAEATQVFDRCFYARHAATIDDFAAIRQRAIWLYQRAQVIAHETA